MSDFTPGDSSGDSDKRRGTVEYGVTLPQGEYCAATIAQSPLGTITRVELAGGRTVEFTQRFVEPPEA